MRALLLGAGALALAMAGPGLTKPGGGHGGGGPPGGHGGGGDKHGGGGDHGGNGGKHGGGHGQQAHHGGGHQFRQQAQRQHGPDRRQAKAERHGGKADRVRGQDARQARVDRRKPQRDARAGGFDTRGRSGGEQRIVQQDTGYRNNYPVNYASNDRGLNYGGNCPPGLAAKGNGCLPPGQAKKLIGQRAPAPLLTSLLPLAYRSWYPDTPDYLYRTGNDYIYRIDRSSNDVLGYAPLYGYGADYDPDYYYAGERYPLDTVSYYNVPAQYQRYYQDEGNWLYRYGDGGIYRVNQSNGLVDSVVALLAGDLAMGQPLPAGYDVYNVPDQYRDRYADTADDWYRYNDGYIYQVDPKTQLITAVIQALV